MISSFESRVKLQFHVGLHHIYCHRCSTSELRIK